MKKLDKIGIVFNVLLSIIYIPLSLFSWLLQMFSERLIYATNPLYITLVMVFCAIASIVPLLCIVAIFVSVILRIKGHSVPSFVIQFVPLAVFMLNFILMLLEGAVVPAIV